jgi:hypothetical protein
MCACRIITKANLSKEKEADFSRLFSLLKTLSTDNPFRNTIAEETLLKAKENGKKNEKTKKGTAETVPF